MGLRKVIDWVPAPFGIGNVPMETSYCDEYFDPEDTCKGCDSLQYCKECGLHYCSEEHAVCPNCQEEEAEE